MKAIVDSLGVKVKQLIFLYSKTKQEKQQALNEGEKLKKLWPKSKKL